MVLSLSFGTLSSPEGAQLTSEENSVAWQHLTGYIVGLEQQVQYYRGLVEEMQHAEVSTHHHQGGESVRKEDSHCVKRPWTDKKEEQELDKMLEGKMRFG